MEQIQNFFSKKLNPLIPIGKMLFKNFMGNYIVAENVDFDNIATEGLHNLEISPEKLNRLLEDQPFLCEKGVISSVSLGLKLKEKKITVTFDGINLTFYPNSQKNYKGLNTLSDFRVNFKFFNFFQDIAEFDDIKKNQKEDKKQRKESDDLSEEDRVSFLEGIVKQFEIELVVTNVNLEIKLEKPSRRGPSFDILVDKIKIKKLRGISASILYSFKFEISKILGFLKIPQTEKSENLFAIQRIVMDQSDNKGAILASIDVLKHTNRNKISIRLSLGSFQGVLTPINTIYVIRLCEKVNQFYIEKLLFDEKISELILNSNYCPSDYSSVEWNSSMGTSLYESFESSKVILKNIEDFAGFTKNLYKSSKKYEKNPENWSLLMKENKFQKTKNFEKVEQDSSINPPIIEEPIIDIHLSSQGFFFCIFKEQMPTTDFFEFLKERNNQGELNFSCCLCSHFLLKITDIEFCYTNEESYTEESPSWFKIFGFELEDFQFRDMGNQQVNRFTSMNTKYESMNNESYRSGMYQSFGNKEDSYYFGMSRGEDSSNLFATVNNDVESSNYQRGKIFEILNQKSTKLDKKPVFEAKLNMINKEVNVKVIVEDFKIKIDLEKLEFFVDVDENPYFDRLSELSGFLLREMKTCDQNIFKEREKELFYGGMNEKEIRKILCRFQDNEYNPEVLKFLKNMIFSESLEFEKVKIDEINKVGDEVNQNFKKFDDLNANAQLNLGGFIKKSKDSKIEKISNKARINFKLIIKNFEFDAFCSNEQNYFEPVQLKLTIPNICLKSGKNITLSFMNDIELKIGKSQSLQPLSKKSSMQNSSKKRSNRPIKEEEENQNLQHLVQVLAKEGENIIGFEDSKIIVMVYSLEINFSPENLENLSIFIESLKVKQSHFESQISHISQETSTFVSIMDQTYDLFIEESQIRDITKKIFNSCYPPLFDFNEICAYVGLIGINLKDEGVSKTIAKTQKKDLTLQKKNAEDVEDDWFLVEGDEIQSLKEKFETNQRNKEEIFRSLEIVLRIEFKSLMFNMQQDIQDSKIYDTQLLIHSLRIFDGVTFKNQEKNPKKYKTEFLEIYSVDYEKNPVYIAKLKSQFQIRKCLMTFKKIWSKLDKDGAFLKLKMDQDIFCNELNKGIDRLTINVKEIIFSVVLEHSSEVFGCLIKVLDDTCHRLDNIKTKMEEGENVAEMKEMKKMNIPNVGYSPDFKLIGDLNSGNRSDKKEKKRRNLRLNFELDGVFFDLISNQSYRSISEFKKLTAILDLSPSGKMNLNLRISNLLTFISNSLDAIRIKKVHRSEWLHKSYQQLVYIPLISVHFYDKSDIVKKSEEFELLVTIDNLEKNSKKKPTIYFDIGNVDILYNFITQVLKYLDSGTKKTKFLFRNSSTKTKEIRKIIKQNIVKARAMSGDSDSSGWFEVAGRDAEVRQILSYLKKRAKLRKKDSIIRDKELFDSLYEGGPVSGLSRLRMDFYISTIEIKIFNSKRKKKKKIKKEKIENRGKKDFVLRFENINVSVLGDESKETEDSKIVSRVKYSLIGNVKEVYIIDNVVDSIYSNILKFDSESFNFYFRITENVLQKESFGVVGKRARGKSLSGSELQNLINESETRKRLMSDDNDYKTELERYFDKVAVVIDIKPLKLYLYSSSVDVLKGMAEHLNIFMKSVQFSNSIDAEDPLQRSIILKKKNNGPYFCVDFIFTSEFEVKIFAMSNSNLNLVNYLPNLHFKLKEKYLEFLEGASSEMISKSIMNEVFHDLRVGKIVRVNIKNLPIFASVYKLGGIVESMFRAAGKKNAEGVTKAINSLMKFGISSFLKTGKFGVKAMSDILKMVGLGFVNQSGIDYVFEKVLLKVNGGEKTILKRR